MRSTKALARNAPGSATTPTPLRLLRIGGFGLGLLDLGLLGFPLRLIVSLEHDLCGVFSLDVFWGGVYGVGRLLRGRL